MVGRYADATGPDGSRTPDFASNGTNRKQAEASASSFSLPSLAVFSGTELFVADTNNNRVVVLPQSGGSFGAATRVLGEDQMNLSSINLVEGREFRFTSGTSADGGIVADLTANPPHLYVADTYNNRVLGYNDLRKVRAGRSRRYRHRTTGLRSHAE